MKADREACQTTLDYCKNILLFILYFISLKNSRSVCEWPPRI